jgi:transcriptional regulator with XRE-family HTH domain
MDFPQRLADAISGSGLSQSDLAKKLDLSSAAISAWCTGAKKPSLPNLERLAEVLGVSPAYLQFGETDRTIDGRLLEALRTLYRDAATWYWRPAPRDLGREFGNAAGYAFETSIPTLTRESGQNISDEKIDTEATVEARYTVIELTGQHLSDFLERLRFDQLRPHLEAAANHKKAGPAIKRGLAQVDEGRLLLFRIEDVNASGLTGPEFAPGRFMAVVRNILDSQKGDGAGGSFGLGKATLWSSSHFGLVLTNSNLSVGEEGRRDGRFMGRIDLPWHEVDGDQWAGPGWFGVPDIEDTESGSPRTVSLWGNEALAQDMYMSRAAGLSGTTFLIVGAYDASGAVHTVEEIADEFARSLADNFWPAMADRPDGSPPRLRAIVRAQRNDHGIFEKYVNPAEYQAERVAALTRYLNADVTESLDAPGDVVERRITLNVPKRIGDSPHSATEHEAIVLITQADDNGDRRPETQAGSVVFMRGSHMVIQTLRVGALPIGSRPFHAIVLAGEAAGNSPADKVADRFLRHAEPPAHNKWTGTPDLTANYARGGKASIEAFESEVKKAIRDVIRQPSRDLSDGPDALKELLRMVPPTSAGKRPRVRSVRDHSITEDNAWQITDAMIALPARSDGKGWTISPVLRFGTESGAPVPVKWRLIEPIANCTLDSRQRLVIPPGVRTARFSATTDPATHPVGARRATVLVDLRVQNEGATS